MLMRKYFSYEVVLPDGNVVECSPEQEPDLFFSLPWSYGTIGFLTCVELDIIPSRRFGYQEENMNKLK